jgi:hypothetical protein
MLKIQKPQTDPTVKVDTLSPKDIFEAQGEWYMVIQDNPSVPFLSGDEFVVVVNLDDGILYSFPKNRKVTPYNGELAITCK